MTARDVIAVVVGGPLFALALVGLLVVGSMVLGGGR
jgi:hypothetical protein